MDNAYHKIIEAVGDDPEREGLQKTPKRAAKAMRELTSGYQESLDDIVNGAIYEAKCQDMVIIKDIEIYSLCEHHILPFIGRCHIAYIPKHHVIGLSKLARIADMFARRLQIQETLTHEIAEAIFKSIDPIGVAVTIEAEHMCMRMRGVGKQNSIMVTSSMLGLFREDAKTRTEFLSLIRP